ncbi:hypothetical protein [Microvirga sp. VF16]|uniref:hypothetical protein n=1 Tax=Microvirga sp. VF16 TaxID=2807101 RepID=UPI00193D94DF|nr:hypothetical protein [Microvirga sp. VF16]QRM28163.1 hypothetical protein JO965_18190 [Microvirga sp. VF16]
MAVAIEVSAEQKRRAYEYYFNCPSMNLHEIAARIDVSRRTFVRLRDSWGWPHRAAALALKDRDGVDAAVEGRADDPSEALSAPAALRDTARSLARVTKSQIKALVKEQRAGRVTSHAKTAQILASYAKTLMTAQALLEQEGSPLDESEHHSKPRRSLHELRDELAHHLNRVIAEEEARGCDGILV